MPIQLRSLLQTQAKSYLASSKLQAIAANTTVELLTAPLIVQENEILKVTAATADRLHVVTSFLEIS
jgi:hypothetical protein